MIERLDRIEAILEQTAQSTEANRGAISGDKPLCVYAQLGSTVNSLLQIRNFAAIVTEQREFGAEIRELRTESQPILEHLFGIQENGK